MRPRHLAEAWRFLTIIPLPRRTAATPEDLARSMAFYPAVGLILGAVLTAADWGMLRILPGEISALMAVGLLAVLSGGIHLDGLADTADGILGGRDREESLRIMRDERIGVFGVIALILIIVAKYQALSHLSSGDRAMALLTMPAVGRWSMVAVSYRAVYARTGEGLARPFLALLSWREVAWASLFLLGGVIWAFGPAGVAYAGAVAILGLSISMWLRARIGGLSGDCIGAIGEVSEAFFLILILAAGRF